LTKIESSDIEDVFRERLDGREIVDMMIELEKAYKPEVFGIEKMQVSQAIGPFLREEMIRKDVWPNLVQLRAPRKGQNCRSRSIQARVRAKRVKFNKGAEWYQDFEDEFACFLVGNTMTK
jgi:hypothetical protein